MKFDKNFAYSFIIGYFILSFVLLFGPLNLYFLNAKLFWADLGLLFTIILGYLSQNGNFQKGSVKEQNTTENNHQKK